MILPILIYGTGPPVTQWVIYPIWLNNIQHISFSVAKHYEILFLKALSRLHSEGVVKTKNLLYKYCRPVNMAYEKESPILIQQKL